MSSGMSTHMSTHMSSGMSTHMSPGMSTHMSTHYTSARGYLYGHQRQQVGFFYYVSIVAYAYRSKMAASPTSFPVAHAYRVSVRMSTRMPARYTSACEYSYIGHNYISPPSRHRRRHVHRPSRGYGRTGTQNDRLSQAVILSTGTPIPARWTCRRRCRDGADRVARPFGTKIDAGHNTR